MSDSTERLGELLVRLKILNDQQVEKILEYQKKHQDLFFGQIAVRLNDLTEEKVHGYL